VLRKEGEKTKSKTNKQTKHPGHLFTKAKPFNGVKGTSPTAADRWLSIYLLLHGFNKPSYILKLSL
jgi:hypothetical protein